MLRESTLSLGLGVLLQMGGISKFEVVEAGTEVVIVAGQEQDQFPNNLHNFYYKVCLRVWRFTEYVKSCNVRFSKIFLTFLIIFLSFTLE